MSIDQNKLLVRRYYEEVVSTGDIRELAKFIAPGYTEVYLNVRHEIGVEGAREHVLGVRRVFPDLQVTVEQQIAQGEWVVSRVTARGTHTGEWMGMKPTGERLGMTGVNIDQVVDGLIIEHGGAANLLEPLLESGAIEIVGAPDQGSQSS